MLEHFTGPVGGWNSALREEIFTDSAYPPRSRGDSRFFWH